MGLQKIEGLVMLIAGLSDMVLHVYGNHGSIFRPLFGYSHGNWMKNEQHFLDLAVWVLAGKINIFKVEELE